MARGRQSGDRRHEFEMISKTERFVNLCKLGAPVRITLFGAKVLKHLIFLLAMIRLLL